MSFVRLGRPQQHNKGKKPARPKKAAGAKKEWVSTVNDLSVHKPTAAELNHRHEMHKSHNQVAAQWELREKALKRRLRYAGSPAPLDKASLSIIREVFSDQLLLQDVLSRSDRALAVVKDLFGDAPRRQTGHPSVTMAPNCDPDSDLPVLQRPEPPTQLALLSQSMMDQEALNELHASEEDHSDEDPDGWAVRRAGVRKTESRGRAIPKRKAHRHISHHGHGDSVPVTPCTRGAAPDPNALNATLAVKRLHGRPAGGLQTQEEPSVLVSQVLNPGIPYGLSGKSRTQPTRKCNSPSSELNGSSVASLSGDQSSLGLLRSMLGQVEADLDSVSPDAEPESAQSPNRHRSQGLTGFSVALIGTLGRLVHNLKQMDERLRKEAEARRKMEEELREQRGLVDALTAESMSLRELVAHLQTGLERRTAEAEQRLDSVVLLMGGLGLLGPHADAPHAETAVCQPAPVPAALVSPAFLLSPPQQRDNGQPGSQQLPPVDRLSLQESLQSQLSSPSLPSLSSAYPPSPDPQAPRRPPEAVLAEIAELSRQNRLIRAELNQARIRHSGGSSGSVSPQGVGGTRSSGSGGHRRSKVTEGQVTPPGAGGVEQRLLELNRQSAAARGRLLELIRQQKDALSSGASPSASPVPTSASSPPTTAGGGRPAVSGPQPHRENPSPAGSSSSSSSSSRSSAKRFDGGGGDGGAQAEQPSERDAWFSLSAHVR